MTTDNPFSSERDTELGGLLRAHLEGSDHAGFTAGVRARLAGVPVGRQDESLWEVLAAWARPGIAAGFLLATLAGAVLAMQASGSTDANQPVLAETPERDEFVGVVLGAAR